MDRPTHQRGVSDMSLRAAIIGAGAAGGACAVTLARRGFDVTLVEAKRFPRAKVCGEFISPAATAHLESLLSPERLRDLGARRVRTFHIDRAVGKSDRTISWTMPEPAWALSRATLDHALADESMACGAGALLNTRVRGVAYRDDGATLTLEGEGAGELDVDLVIHADGRAVHDPSPNTPARRGVLAHKCHFVPPEPIDGLRMRAAKGAYVGTIQVEGELATCALVARRELIARHRADADAMLRSLWPGFDPAWRRSDWMACPVPGSPLIRPGHPRSVRIGNAAGAVEPVGGEGIGLALWAGVELGRALAATVSDVSACRALFLRRYRSRLGRRRVVCRLMGEAMLRPAIVGALWGVLSRPAVSIGPLYRLSGKPTGGRRRVTPSLVRGR